MSAPPSLPGPFAGAEGSRAAPRAWTGAASIAVHIVAHGAVLVLPLLYDKNLPETATQVRAFFAEPLQVAAPPPPPPPPPAAARAPSLPHVATPATGLVAPVEIPTEIIPEQGLDLGVEGGAPGGVEGGVPGGVVGGVVGGMPDAPPPPPMKVLRAGIDVTAPRKLKDVPPVYPTLAVEAHVQGVVTLECRVDPRGRIAEVKVLRGILLLNDAAVEAVRQWVYTPTLVNGVPVPVLMTVTVTFQLTRPS